MDKEFLRQTTPGLPHDVADTVEVFLYRNLSAIISPTPSVLLTPVFQAGLQAALNHVGTGYNVGLAKDLKEILDVFIVTNAGVISVSAAPQPQIIDENQTFG